MLSTPDAHSWLFPFSAVHEPRGAPFGAKAAKRRLRHSHLPRCGLGRSYPDSYHHRCANFAEEDCYYPPRRYAPQPLLDRSSWCVTPSLEEDLCEFCGCSRLGSGRADRGYVQNFAQALDATASGCSTECPSYCSSLDLSSPTVDTGIGWFPALEVSPSPYYDYVEEEEEESLPPALVEFAEDEVENCGEIFHYILLDDERDYLQLDDFESPQPPIPPAPIPLYERAQLVQLPDDLSPHHHPAILPLLDDENCVHGGEPLVELVDDELALVACSFSEDVLNVEDNSGTSAYTSSCYGGDELSPSHAPAPVTALQLPSSPGWLPLQPGDVYYYAANSSVLCMHTDDLGALAGKVHNTSLSSRLTSPYEG